MLVRVYIKIDALWCKVKARPLNGLLHISWSDWFLFDASSQVYPGLMITSGFIHYVLNSLNITVHIRDVCVFLAPTFRSGSQPCVCKCDNHYMYTYSTSYWWALHVTCHPYMYMLFSRLSTSVALPFGIFIHVQVGSAWAVTGWDSLRLRL